jgi:hypothetical protein
VSNKYSIGGYKIALRARTHRTVLVEGKDDKELFNRLKISLPHAVNFNIDTSDILSDIALYGLGAKAKIDALAIQIAEGSEVASKIRCFVDREWEHLVDPDNQNPLPWQKPQQRVVRIATCGHSIENYGFSLSFVEEYLRHFGGGLASPDIMDRIGELISEILRASAAFSEVARRRGAVNRCCDICDLNDISFRDGIMVFSDEVQNKLHSRGLENHEGFLDEYVQRHTETWCEDPFAIEANYHAHGHIGEAILWLGVARVIVDSGFPEAVGREVATGRRDEKRRVWHGWLSSLPPAEIAPIHAAFS